ncbi:MAG: hypothetical protein CL910_12445 [Deltaproteobacteria bacterium]|jgi:hypothetical protein|nr:hypothetical protein [Deltaproteobacteria bacterium]
MSRRFALAAIAALLVPCFLLSASAQDEPPARWDQARGTQYGKELAVACSELKASLSALPAQVEPGAQRAFYQARDDVRLLDHAAKSLATALEAGEGKEEALPRFKRIQMLRRDAEENGRKALIPDDVFAKITPVGVALIKLAPYFR